MCVLLPNTSIRSAIEFPTRTVGRRFYTIGRCTRRLHDLVRTHRTLNTTSCSHRVAFVCPAGKLLNKNSHLRVAFVCGSGAIVWPSVGIVLASAVDCLLTKFGANFARNWKFHIRMAILCQFRDSVTPAVGWEPGGKPGKQPCHKRSSPPVAN